MAVLNVIQGTLLPLTVSVALPRNITVDNIKDDPDAEMSLEIKGSSAGEKEITKVELKIIDSSLRFFLDTSELSGTLTGIFHAKISWEQDSNFRYVFDLPVTFTDTINVVSPK